MNLDFNIIEKIATTEDAAIYGIRVGVVMICERDTGAFLFDQDSADENDAQLLDDAPGYQDFAPQYR